MSVLAILKERDSKTIGSMNHGVELSNIDLSSIETITSSEDFKLRQFKRRTSSEPLESPSEIILDVSNIN